MTTIHGNTANLVGSRLLAVIQQPSLIFIFATIAIVLHTLRKWSPKKPRFMPNVYIAGLAEGTRSLEEARLRFRDEAADMFVEGYKQTNGGFYYVPGPDADRLMIPLKYMDELKNAPDNRVDFLGSVREMFDGEYTTIGKGWTIHPKLVKHHLNPNLPIVLPHVEEEISVAAARVLPPCKDWTPVPIYYAVKEMICQASNRMIGGVELCRNQEWLKTSLTFETDAWLAAQRLKQYPFWTRPIAQWMIPEMSSIRHHIKVARKFIKPILKERQKLSGAKDKPVDLLQMISDSAQGADRDENLLAYTGLVVSFAAIHTSATVPSHLFIDLCAYPEYIQPLREEAEKVLAADGHFTKANLSKLVKLDSFMKESQRINPLSFITFGREVHGDLELHDGTVIPAGTIIGVPADAIAKDANLCKDPERFDGFRWVPPPPDEKQPDKALPPTFVTTNPQNLAWGYGKHACSGRFFAGFEIKMLMAHILLKYDFKFEDGVRERPKSLVFELQNTPDPAVKILFKRRSV